MIACALAAAQGIRTTRDLDWPGEADLSRDISVAETMRGGHLLSDSAYRDEWAWYNPLVPGIVAVASVVSHQPVHVLYARAGAYLNLLAPLALFAMLAALFDQWVALVTTIAFLFLWPGQEPAWSAATYSPWLMVVNFVQAPFYLALWMVVRLATSLKRSDFVLAGAAIGVVMLGHVAPTLIVSVVVAFEARRRLLTSEPDARPRLLGCFASLAGTALLVSSPLLISIVGHYHLRVRNTGPANWVFSDIDIVNLPMSLRHLFIVSPMKVLALVGVVFLLRSKEETPARVILVAAATTFGFLVYSYIVQYVVRTSGIELPALVPGFHFLFYLRAFATVAFGIGVIGLVRCAAGFGSRLLRVPFEVFYGVSVGLVIIGLSVAVARAYDGYRDRPDFGEARANAQRMFSSADLRAMREWILTSTSRNDVFLAPDNLGLSVVTTAGRKVVVLDRSFSNPFVDWEQRMRDRDEMLQLIQHGDPDKFMRLAAHYRVRYVAYDMLFEDELALRCGLHRVWSSGPWHIYKIG